MYEDGRVVGCSYRRLDTFRLCRGACRNGLRAMLEQLHSKDTIRLIMFLSPVALPNERNKTIFEVKTGVVVVAIK